MASLSSLMGRYRNRLSAAAIGSTIEAGDRVIDRSPVLSGSMVLSWGASIDSQSTKDESLAIPFEATKPYGLWMNPKEWEYKSSARDDLSVVANFLAMGDDLFFTNPKEYSLEVEYDRKSYHKAPTGMVGRTVAEWQQIVNQQVRIARNGI